MEPAFISDEEFLKAQGKTSSSSGAVALLNMFDHYNEFGFTGNSYVLQSLLERQASSLEDFFVRTIINELYKITSS